MAAPIKKSVELFYDVVSPYSWVAFEVLCRYKTKWNIDLKLKPFFLGGVMQSTGNRPPAMVPNKAKYMNYDIERLKNHFAVPLKRPENFAEVMFEKGSLSAQRFITAIDMESPEHTEAISRSLWMRIWHKDVPITDADDFVEAGKNAGLSDDLIQRALSRIKDQEVKDRLKSTTEEALNYGAFGAPTMLVEIDGKKEMFFGNDRFPIMAEIMGEQWQGPLRELSKCKL